jgi:hypothetical protein
VLHNLILFKYLFLKKPCTYNVGKTPRILKGKLVWTHSKIITSAPATFIFESLLNNRRSFFHSHNAN